VRDFTAGVFAALTWVRLYLKEGKVEELKEEIEAAIEGILNEEACNFEVLAQAYAQNT